MLYVTICAGSACSDVTICAGSAGSAHRLRRVTDFDPGTPPEGADDHTFAAWAASAAGDLLVQVRQDGLTGKELKDAGDLASHDLLMELIAEHRPGRRRALRGGQGRQGPARPRAGSGSSTRSTAPASSPSRRATTGPSTSRSGRTASWSPVPWPSPVSGSRLAPAFCRYPFRGRFKSIRRERRRHLDSTAAGSTVPLAVLTQRRFSAFSSASMAQSG